MASWPDVVSLIAKMPGDPGTRRGAHLRDLASMRGASPAVGDALRDLHDLTGLETLGELLDDPEVERILNDNFDRNERRVLLRALPALVLRFQQERGAAKPPTPAGSNTAAGAPPAAAASEPGDRPISSSHHAPDVVPEGGAELRRWAHHHGIPFDDWEVRVRIGTRIHGFEIAAMADLESYPRLGASLGAERGALRRIAADLLVERARANVALTRARGAFDARRDEPTSPIVRGCLVVLRRLRETRVPRARPALPIPALFDEVDELHLPFVYPAAEVTFSPSPPYLAVRVEGALPLPARIDLDTGEVSHLGVPSTHRNAMRDAVIEAAIDALCDPDSPARRALEAWAAKPAWRHVLDGLDADLARLDEASRFDAREERVAFRIGTLTMMPEVLLQSPRRGGGGYTAGRVASRRDVRHRALLDALDEDILDAIDAVERGRLDDVDDAAPRRAVLRLFELLGRHPRVALEGRGTSPVRVVRAPLRLVPTGAPGGHRARLFLGEHEVTESGLSLVVGHAPPGGDVLLWAPLDPASRAVLHAVNAHREALPDEAIDALFRTLHGRSGVELAIELPEALRGAPAAGPPRTLVALTSRAGATIAASIRLRPWEGAPLLVPGRGPSTAYGVLPGGARVHAPRRLDDEIAAAERVVAALGPGIEVGHDFDLDVVDPDRAADVVVALAELGDAIDVEWEGPPLRVARTATPSALRLTIERRRDWFGVDGGVEVDGEKVGLAALLEAMRARRRFVRLKKGGLLAISRELRERLERADDLLIADGGRLGVGPHAVERLGALVEAEAQIEATREWIALRDRWRAARALEPAVPATFGAALRPYQQAGFAWLARLAACGVGGVLADDMGLGKTVQALALLTSRAADGPAIVVAPTSVCGNWEIEAARFAPALRVLAHRGAGRVERLPALGPGDLVVVSYDVLVRDVEALAAVRFGTIVLDEAHALKNAASKRAQAARRLEGDARLALTGTPVENRLGELWSLFRVLMPSLFGPWERFRDRFATPIERDHDPERRAALAELVRPYLLRRTKGEVAPELPPRTELVRFVDLSEEERELYEAERRTSIEALTGRRGDEDARFAIFSALLRLRQLACHPRLRHDDAKVASSKLAAAVELLEEVREGGHRALVFSQFTTHLALVAEALRERGFTLQELDGSTPAAVRAARVAAFQAGEGDVFLISLKAGGVGLNLTAADTVVHLDPWWNPAAEDQASDRAHRIGQDRPVTIVRLIARGTIEETVLALHEEKRALAEAILAGGDASAGLSTAELVALMERGGSRGESDGAASSAAPGVGASSPRRPRARRA